MRTYKVLVENGSRCRVAIWIQAESMSRARDHVAVRTHLEAFPGSQVAWVWCNPPTFSLEKEKVGKEKSDKSMCAEQMELGV